MIYAARICALLMLFMTTTAVLAAAAKVDVPSGAYGLDKTHGYITFGYSHLGFSNPEVGFNEFDVELMLDAADLQNSTLKVTIDVSSIDSRVAEFDKHLKNADYFDVANHPGITFVSMLKSPRFTRPLLGRKLRSVRTALELELRGGDVPDAAAMSLPGEASPQDVLN